jgi:hypothetical protein
MVDILVDIFRFLHFIGLAALVGGLLIQIRKTPRAVNRLILDGALTQLITGIVLLILTLQDANHIKATVKFVVLIGVLILVLLRRKRTLPPMYYFSILLLSIGNIAIAVFW